jgi:DNA-binding MurR/RpiR family transcriptional regulator
MHHDESDAAVRGAIAHIHSVLPDLLPSEQRVAQICLSRPGQVVEWTATELAEAAGTSRATVVRASQHMGFKGFQHLRLMLARDTTTAPQMAENPIGPDATPEQVVGTYFAVAADILANALSPLDWAAVERAVDALSHTRRLLIVANGGSNPAAQEAALQFLSMGQSTESPTDAITQHMSARMLQPGDVCVAISGSGVNDLTLRAAEAAKESGATVIGVTHFPRSSLARLADIPLVVGFADLSLKLDQFSMRIAPALLLSAIRTSVSMRRRDMSEVAESRALEIVGEVIRER